MNKHIGQKIKLLRGQAGLSQDQLAKTLGVLRPIISQIENGERKVTAEELITLAEALNTEVEIILGLKKEPAIQLESEKDMPQTKNEIRINVPQKNLRKFKEVLLYILNKVGAKPNMGETVLYKLLYFMDFNFYEKYEKQLIGATYIKNHYGPTPVEFHKIVETMLNKDLVAVKSKYFEHEQKKYLPLRPADVSSIGACELEMIEQVLRQLSDKNAAQLTEYSHQDVPWLTAKDGQKIDYESVFYRTPLYSVREYGAKD
jgi:transcriptional regulator with XRE-family HTH domain